MNARTLLIPMLALAAAVLAPSALADRPDDRAGARGPGAIATPQASLLRPDDRAGVRGPGAYEAQLPAATRPDDRVGVRGPGALDSPAFSSATRPDDRAGARGPGSIPTTVVQPASSGFDWGDALIGGLGGIGTALMLMGVLFLVTSRRSRPRVA